jgi:hypothetical protein
MTWSAKTLEIARIVKQRSIAAMGYYVIRVLCRNQFPLLQTFGTQGFFKKLLSS